MLKNYIKIAFRNLVKDRVYSLINVIGLAVGMACCLFILLYIQEEFSYDRFHSNSDRIYRAVLDLNRPDGTRHFASTPYALAPAAESEFASVKEFVRLYRSQPVATEIQDRQFEESRFYFADAAFLDLFSFGLSEGNPATALESPYSVILSRETARRYFGDEGPLGRNITVNDSLEFEVTGVFDEIPSKSHFQFDFIASMSSWETLVPSIANAGSWAPHIYHTYLLLSEYADPEAIGNGLSDLATQRVDFSRGTSFGFELQPLTNIHLYSHRENELQANSNARTLYLFGAIGLFILMIACFNFVNLSTARSEQRMKEVGIRKTLGANREQLFVQFMGEMFLMSLLALLLGLLLMDMLLPFLNEIAGKQLAVANLITGSVPLWIGGALLIVSFAAGVYPALFLSAFKPVRAIKGSRSEENINRGVSFSLRKSLVVLQFVMSVALIFSTVVVYQQLQFMRNHNLGFEAEQVLVLPSLNGQMLDKAELVKNETLRNTAVSQAAISSNIPGRGAIALSVRSEEMAADEWKTMNTQFVDPDYVETFEMEVIAGRDFAADRASDTTNVFMFNETAAREFGWDPAEAVGKEVAMTRGSGRVIGVVRDFNYLSLKESIEPLVIVGSPVAYGSAPLYVSLRLNTDELSETIAVIEQLWQSVVPERTFSYFFLDDDFDRQYRAEQRLGEIFGLFAVLAIVIACMGLFGLATFAAKRRIKEIGIRKVMGATVTNIVSLLSKDFLLLVILGFVIAAPTAWYIMNRWLADFAYRMQIGLDVFVLAGVAALLIAMATVSWQAVKAALMDPVKSLRNE